MYESDISTILKSRENISAIEALNRKFLDHIRSNSFSEAISSKIEIIENRITLNCFNYFVEARPRLVGKNGNFSIEYKFTTDDNGYKTTVWLMYLHKNGEISVSPSQDDNSGRMFDYNDPLIATHLGVLLHHATLYGELYTPEREFS